MSTPTKRSRRQPPRRRTSAVRSLAGQSSRRRTSQARRRYRDELVRPDHREGKAAPRATVETRQGRPKPQRPARPRLGRLVGLLLAAGLIALLIFVFVDDRFYVQTADIQGQRFSASSDLYRLAGVHGYSVFWVNSQEAARRIETLPFVESATVHPVLPDRLHIQVVEREPVAVWRVDGKDYWVDRAGVTLPVVSGLANLPLLEDHDGSSVRAAAGMSSLDAAVFGTARPSGGSGVNPQLVAALLALHEQLPEVGQFAYDKTSGFYFTDPLGTLVSLGQPQGLAKRIRLMKTLQDSLVSQGQAPAEINFRHEGGFFYKPASAPAN